ENLRERIKQIFNEIYERKEAQASATVVRQFEKAVMLQTLDTHWREHLASMDHLRQGIHLRGYAQKNPKQEYKREAFELFGQMLDMIKNEVVKIVMKVRIQTREEIQQAEEQLSQNHLENVHYQHADFNPELAPEEL